MTNCGAETPTNDATISVESTQVPRLTAAISPIVSPITSSQTMAPAISSSVAGRREAISSATCDLLQVRAAEIAAQQGAEVAQVLLPERQVEAELLADVLDGLGSGAAARRSAAPDRRAAGRAARR